MSEWIQSIYVAAGGWSTTALNKAETLYLLSYDMLGIYLFIYFNQLKPQVKLLDLLLVDLGSDPKYTSHRGHLQVKSPWADE